MSIETVVVDQFIYDKLAADSTLLALLAASSASLFSEMVAQGSGYPLVLWTQQSALDDEYVNNERIWTNCVVTVRGLAEQNSFGGDLKTIAQRLDGALHKQSASTTDGRVYACVRIRAFRMIETLPGGEQIRHLGGVYRIYAKET